jgi:hypothetical protein
MLTDPQVHEAEFRAALQSSPTISTMTPRPILRRCAPNRISPVIRSDERPWVFETVGPSVAAYAINTLVTMLSIEKG